MRMRVLAAGLASCLCGAAAFAGGAPDLQITGLGAPGVAEPGETISVFVEVSETRTQLVSATFTVGIYFSASGAVDPLTDAPLATWDVPGLAAGDSASTTLAATLPTGMPSGIYFLVAYADINDTVAEQRENNNATAIEIVLPSATPFGGGCAGGGGGHRTGAAWAVPLLAALGLLCVVGRNRSGGRRARAHRPLAGLLLLVLVTAAGCMLGEPLALRGPDVPLGGDLVAASPEAVGPARHLAAAKPGGVGARPIGARGGIVMPIGEDESEYKGSIMFGAFYPGTLKRFLGMDDIPFEAGLDFGFIDADDNTIEATMLVFRFDMLFSRWNASGARPDVYLLGGYELVDAIYEVHASGTDSEVASGLNLGVGASWESGWDARFTWSVLLGSDNIGSLWMFSGNYRF
ncbi:MAG: CARDB domain-containing protein [Planctomycetota bacterium]|jgi:hypothetical protein